MLRWFHGAVLNMIPAGRYILSFFYSIVSSAAVAQEVEHVVPDSGYMSLATY